MAKKRKSSRKAKKSKFGKRISLFIVALVIAYSVFTYVQAEDNPPQTSLEIPLCKATVAHKNGDDHEVHTYNGFQLCYRETYELPEWVSYTLKKENLVSKAGRENNFREDPEITTGSADLSDYRGSGYDRGHLAPAADFKWSKESMDDTFLMSNMSPQAPEFNRKIWMYLEKQVRTWASKYGEVVVVTGPVLEKNADKYPSIGRNRVAVPEYFYKVLLARKENGKYIAAGFIVPNRKCEESFYDFQVSVDEVERRTGLDFFSALDDDVEDEIEGIMTEW